VPTEPALPPGPTGRDRPLLVYDGDCAVCTRLVRVVERWFRRDPERFDIAAWQLVDLDDVGTTQERAEYELLWVHAGTSHARIDGGAQAVASLLVHCGGLWAVLGWLLRVPPVRWLAHGVYRLVANNRDRLPGGTPACALPADQRPGARRAG
jgi:predicted DCC family thiol-disulfide oxidoreductase YuxK